MSVPIKPEIEDELREFMREARAADMAGDVRNIREGVHAIRAHQAEHEVKDETRFGELRGDIRGLSLRVGALEKSDEKLEDKLERSGSWDREALQAQAMVARDDANWWKRNWISMVAAVVAIGSAIAALVKK